MAANETFSKIDYIIGYKAILDEYKKLKESSISQQTIM
jgi:hypothetical protein